jgi:Zinc knuckle
MREGEDVVDYGRRSVKLCERLTSTGEPEPQRPKPKEQSLRFIDGFSSSISTYLDYKNYLSNSLTVTGVDIYSATLVAAINSLTKAVQPTNPSGTTYTALAALEGEKPKGNLELGETGNSSQTKTNRHPIHTPGGEKYKDWKSKVKCHICGKLGHIKRECRGKKKDSPRPPHTAAAIIANDDVINEHSSFYSEFGQMYDGSDTMDYKTCNMVVTKTPGATSIHGVTFGLAATTTSIQPVKSTNVAFNTRATGSIVMNDAILAKVSNCRATEYRGLNGSLMVSKGGQLGDIGVVHYDPRAKLSILSASDCWHLGHQWEFKVGDHIDSDSSLLHTQESTYRFKHKEGLYICDMETKPEPRHIGATNSKYPYSTSKFSSVIKTNLSHKLLPPCPPL